MTPADGKVCQWTGVATLTIPPKSGSGQRTVTGSWTQAKSDTKARNIQFHAIAVDAGKGPVGSGGGASCSSSLC